MDTSKEYIKMCEKAEEIQEIFHGKNRSWNWYPSFVWDKAMQRKAITIWQHSILMEKLGNTIEALNVSIEYDNDGRIDINEKERLLKKDWEIWLPRQDQLQEIILKSNACNIMDYTHDNYYLELEYFSIFKTMEQLWLGFVMKEKYNKIWNGKECRWN